MKPRKRSDLRASTLLRGIWRLSYERVAELIGAHPVVNNQEGSLLLCRVGVDLEMLESESRIRDSSRSGCHNARLWSAITETLTAHEEGLGTCSKKLARISLCVRKRTVRSDLKHVSSFSGLETPLRWYSEAA
mmetsp:Transcript_252/g.622  ORF Transcript_252/g.622 Transcript_252/m.622 type:complete len:133 (-) Transcript_252:227-625(-)